MKLKVTLIAVGISAAFSFASLGLTRGAGSNPLDTQENTTPTSHQPSVISGGEPTTIQEGVMTEKQREHSKLFKGYAGEVTRGKKLSQLVGERGDLRIVRYPGTLIVPRSVNLNDFLQKLACEADAVVIGAVKAKSSHIAEEGAFLFTDYDLTVEEILKNTSQAPIQPADEITVTRTGGSVKLNGHKISTVDLAQKPLEIGTRYLLFLRLIPTTGAYKSLNDKYYDNSFKLTGSNITQVSDLLFPFGPNGTASAVTFLAQVRSAIGNCGN